MTNVRQSFSIYISTTHNYAAEEKQNIWEYATNRATTTTTNPMENVKTFSEWDHSWNANMPQVQRHQLRYELDTNPDLWLRKTQQEIWA